MSRKKSKVSDQTEIEIEVTENETDYEWSLSIHVPSKIHLTEDEFIMCLESYVSDWFKKKTGSAFGEIKKAKH